MTVETCQETAFCSACGVRSQAQDRMPVELRDLPLLRTPGTPGLAQAPLAMPRARLPGQDLDRGIGCRPTPAVADHSGRHGGDQAGRRAGSLGALGGTRDGTRLADHDGCGVGVRQALGRSSRSSPSGSRPGTKFLSADPEHHTRYVSTVVDLGPRIVVDLLEGNSADDISDWCRTRSLDFLRGIQVVATDLTNSYRNGIKGHLDHAVRVADPFHVVRVAVQAMADVRRRVQNQTTGHRGRKGEPLYGIRKLLDTGLERLSESGYDRLLLNLRIGDPDDEVHGAWLAKKSVRDLYLTSDPEEAAVLLDKVIVACRQEQVPELRRLGQTPQPLAPGDPQPPPHRRQQRPHRGHESLLRVLLFGGGVIWPHRPGPPAIR